MVERWKSFDWREVEARINAHPNYRTEIDGQTIHFVHVRSVGGGRSAHCSWRTPTPARSWSSSR